MIRTSIFMMVIGFLLCDVVVVSAQEGQSSIANPSSVYCVDHGGKVLIIENAIGSQSGICMFSDGSQCDEWQYFNGKCTPGQTIPSPLYQIKERIYPNYVKCIQGLQLVIKKEDGSPACVQPDSATKLLKQGWASKIVSPTSSDTNSQSSDNSTITPLQRTVFFMKPNSTGTIIVRYHATWNYLGTIDLTQGLSVYDATNFVPIPNSGLTVNVNPQFIGHTDGKNYDVTYTFVAKPGTKGIFGIDTSCAENMDIAIGIDPSQIQPSDVPVPRMGAALCVMSGFIDVHEIDMNNITSKEIPMIAAQ